MADIVENNIDRFSGYAQLYHGYRPEVPESVIDILIAYLGRRPDVVVDLGCGTGLSSFLWGPVAGRIVGVEPNDDMRHQAMEENSRRGLRQMEFVNGLSTAIPLEDGVADVVTCSQSFHWMNPQPTLAEIHRSRSVCRTNEEGLAVLSDADRHEVNAAVEENFSMKGGLCEFRWRNPLHRDFVHFLHKHHSTPRSVDSCRIREWVTDQP